MKNTSTAEIMDKGMSCLLEKLGAVETEYFISVLMREKADYTKWRQKYFADTDPDAFHAAATAYGESHPL